MTGRGRPRKSPDTKCAKGKPRPKEIRQVRLARCPGKDSTEELQNVITEEQKPKHQKKTNHTEEKPSAQRTRKEKTTKFTEETTEQQRTPTDNTKAKTTEQSAKQITKRQPETPKDTTMDALKTTKAEICNGKAILRVYFAEETTKDTTNALVQITKPKTCAGKVKSPQTYAEETTKIQPETPKDTKKAAIKTPKAKRCAGKAKSPEEFRDEPTKMQPETPKDTKKAAIKTPKAKRCAGKAKSPEEFRDEPTKMQPETPKDTKKAAIKTPKAKRCAGKAKSPEEFRDEPTKMQPETPKDTKKAAIKTPKAKRCAGKAKSPEEFRDEPTKMQPETPKDNKKACVPQDRCEDKDAVDSILNTTLEKLKMKMSEKSNAAKDTNEIIKIIITHLKQNTQYFEKVQEPLRTGSYYENLKISHPDEFDVMLPIPVDRVNVTPYGHDGAFYSVALKRGKSPLQKFQQKDILSASEMLLAFREEVKKSVKKFPEWEVTQKKKGCPAVTLTKKVKSMIISLDVVLCLVVKSSWPLFTKEGLKIEEWLGAKVRQEHRRKEYYLVPKYEGRGTVEIDGVFAKDTWRVSFSHIEKAIMKNHGSAKTCCEDGGVRCCRKDCLKLLKHLLSLLKETDPSFDKFCSYHAKTTLLHACCSRTKDSDWSASSLRHCFQLLLKDFVAHLQSGELKNFFIPTQNLLSGPSQTKCNSLARCIEEECDKGFPIFKVKTFQQI